MSAVFWWPVNSKLSFKAALWKKSLLQICYTVLLPLFLYWFFLFVLVKLDLLSGSITLQIHFRRPLYCFLIWVKWVLQLILNFSWRNRVPWKFRTKCSWVKIFYWALLNMLNNSIICVTFPDFEEHIASVMYLSLNCSFLTFLFSYK